MGTKNPGRRERRQAAREAARKDGKVRAKNDRTLFASSGRPFVLAAQRQSVPRRKSRNDHGQ